MRLKLKTDRVWRPEYPDAATVKRLIGGWAWACGMWPIEEIGLVCDGRLDVLLVPLSIQSPIFKKLDGHWTERLGLVGVEVKVDKQDFRNGLESGQFDRYAKELSGLYIAGPPHIVEKSAVPEQYGVIHVGREQRNGRSDPIVCRRHAKFTRSALTEEQHWRIIWAMAKSINRFNRERREEAQSLEHRIKETAGRAIWKALKEISGA